MKHFLREYFTFNRRERNGVFILLSIILILILYLSFSDYFFVREKPDFSKFEKEISEFEKQQVPVDSVRDSTPEYSQNDYKVFSRKNDNKNRVERFDFNPNNLRDSDWNRLGLSEKQIRVIKNYESKGGKFRTKEDVKKMYCIQPELYSSLEPYIQIPEIASPIIEHQQLTNNHQPLFLELNSADSIQLDQLKGIGFSFARRIIKYREMLGGFINKDQLLEVYGLDKEKYDGLAANVSVDISKVKKLNINLIAAEELKKHPYVKYNLANLIVSYRKQHGNYGSVADIKKLNLVNDEIYAKLAPYLTTE